MKIIKISVSICLLLLGMSFQPSTSFAQDKESEIKQLLEERDKELKELVGPKGTEYSPEQRDKLKDIINGIVDYESMAQYALQVTYDTLSVEERTEFVDLFSTIIRDQSLNNLDIYRANVKYENIEVHSDSAIVNTVAQLERVRTPVDYTMKFEGKNPKWVVTDIIIDEVSTAGSYRRQFQSILNKRGYDGLLETLQKRATR